MTAGCCCGSISQCLIGTLRDCNPIKWSNLNTYVTPYVNGHNLNDLNEVATNSIHVFGRLQCFIINIRGSSIHPRTIRWNGRYVTDSLGNAWVLCYRVEIVRLECQTKVQEKSTFIRMQDVTQIAKLMGPTWGPPGSCRPQMGPMLVPWTLLSGYPQTSCLLWRLWHMLITGSSGQVCTCISQKFCWDWGKGGMPFRVYGIAHFHNWT